VAQASEGSGVLVGSEFEAHASYLKLLARTDPKGSWRGGSRSTAQ